MSRGPGRIERRIAAIADSYGWLTTTDLCVHLFGLADGARVEKKHRVSVLRAMRRVVDRDPSLQLTRCLLPGPPPRPEIVLARVAQRAKPARKRSEKVSEPIWAWRCEEKGVDWREATIVRLTKTRATVLFDGREIAVTRAWLLPVDWREENHGWTFCYDRDAVTEEHAEEAWRARASRRERVARDGGALALASQINAAFRARAHQLHPDHGGDDHVFRALVMARESLLASAPG